MLTTLQKAKRAGAKIITVNPLQESGTKRFQHPQNPVDIITGGTTLSDKHFPIKINGDWAFLLLVIKEIFTKFPNYIAKSFIAKHCADFEKYREHVLKTKRS